MEKVNCKLWARTKFTLLHRGDCNPLEAWLRGVCSGVPLDLHRCAVPRFVQQVALGHLALGKIRGIAERAQRVR
jgi:hypothetical protein